MAELLNKLGNQLWHKADALVTDPEAERAAQKVEKTRVAKAGQERVAAEEATRTAKAAADKRLAEQEAERREFNKTRLAKRAAHTAGITLGWVLFAMVSLLGGSLAANALVYKAAPLRVAAFLYGALFSFVVLPYMLLVRWGWYGRRPPYYALLPLVPMRFRYSTLAYLLGWLCFRPDEGVVALAAEEPFTAARP